MNAQVTSIEKSIDCQNYQFNYLVTGNPQLLPVLFLHGFMGDCHAFDPVIASLSQESHCLAIDLPGHGKTRVHGSDELYQMASVAQGIMDCLDVLNVQRCHLIGYSMGGRLALYLTLHFPQYFHKVILESASPGLKTQAEREQRIASDRQLADQLETTDFLSFLTEWYDRPLFASTKQHPDFARMLKQRSQHNPQKLAKSLRNLSSGLQPSLWEKLPENSVPLLLLAGEFDQKFVDINAEIAGRCPLTQLEIIANCGHNIHFERSDVFLGRTRNFLDV
ncbi:MAG: 2-succinyl-6-hydroxy-2,4-cyclohexadiene-1-carboxylate synthase [Cyanobacteria bacterium J06638_20]